MKIMRAFFAATLLALIAISLVPVSRASETLFDGSGSKQTKRRRHRRRKSVRKTVTAVMPAGLSRSASGLTYVMTRPGTGRLPSAGETVIVNYTGVLSNGVKFDSSVERGKPLEFRLGVGRVIKGWDEGIAMMHVGEQATLIIPPQLGYGERGAGGVIPPNATLVFVVELIGIKEAQLQNPER
jgi:FKBP-type peptidyl-prolyl cis-trans isomerase